MYFFYTYLNISVMLVVAISRRMKRKKKKRKLCSYREIYYPSRVFKQLFFFVYVLRFYGFFFFFKNFISTSVLEKSPHVAHYVASQHLVFSNEKNVETKCILCELSAERVYFIYFISVPCQKKKLNRNMYDLVQHTTFFRL